MTTHGQQVIVKKEKKEEQKHKDKILLLTNYDILLTNYDNIPREEALKTLAEIRTKLHLIFKYHIGRANAISPYDLFVQVYGISPLSVDLYRRQYWYEVLKKVIRAMRWDGSCFIVNTNHMFYVLQNKEELTVYHKKLKTHINVLKQLGKRATQWVETEGWKNL